MRFYEIPIILSSTFSKEEADSYIQKISDKIKKEIGEIENIENDGKITLAYPIKKQNSGFFYVIYIKTRKKTLNFYDIIREFNLDDKILRYSIFKSEILEKKYKEKIKQESLEKKKKPIKKKKASIKELDTKLEEILKNKKTK